MLDDIELLCNSEASWNRRCTKKIASFEPSLAVL